MFIWKEIDTLILEKIRNDLDLHKMYKCGAIKPKKRYRMLEIERNETSVKTLARLEPGFEEYLLFDLEDYEAIPVIQKDLVSP